MREKDREVETFHEAAAAADLPMIVVYQQPLDYPDYFVARLFDAGLSTNVIAKSRTLGGIFDTIPDNFHMVSPSHEDDQVIKVIFV